MLKRFTIALAAAGALLALSTTAASAAPHVKKDTVACSTNCISLFPAELGSNVTLNAFVPGDTGVGGHVGTKVNFHLFGNFRPNGDFEPTVEGQVFQFCGFFANDFFSPTSYICLNHPFFDVFEMNWAPFGNESALCAGVASATPGIAVTLRTCGVDNRTIWVADANNETIGGTDCRTPVATIPVGPGVDPSVNYCPWLSGADSNFSQPLVLTDNTGSSNPTNGAQLQRESHVGGLTRSNQLFAFYFG